MEITDDKVNSILGEMITNPKYEKYKFLPEGAMGEIVRDFVEELRNENT